MIPDSPPVDEEPLALVLSELPRWTALLGEEGPLPDLDQVVRVDAAGLQFLASALLWRPGRLALDPAGDTPVARLWRRLGLDTAADALTVEEGGRLVGLRLQQGVAL